MTRAKINPTILRWARQRLQLTEAEVTEKIGLKNKPEILQSWEQGERFPTFRQAQELARVLRIPFGYLFLSQPPQTILPIDDFRTLPEAQRGKFSPELEDVLNDARRKSDWLRERRMETGQSALAFVGRFSINTSADIISEDIRVVLDLPMPTAKNVKTREEHLRTLVLHAEKAGIIVLQSGYVGSNTHRALSVEEFRGFALADRYAPLIFLNAKDSVNGRIFTLAHELAHIWTGTSGISNPEAVLPENGQNALERLCNQVAAELLVPTRVFRERWKDCPLTEETVQELANEFRVSVLVILIRGYETGSLSAKEFHSAYAEAMGKVRKRVNDESYEPGGGDFYRTFYTHNGRLLVSEIVQAVGEGAVLYKEAADLLNVSPKTLEKALSGL
ncbi:MAG TPA: XRE family transcriptional regulator [Candidatus Hydrogenedentes bacterium]|nr:XRE family transcriptional regulator [Candidatus Hydrogenedentota bacterium]HOL78197.1 XRE family transcriptional regulator [Candidatus Hydrogenedentota bacterium]HPO87212.1 XRE family transcriptional regulator [Candidatus Hydrogenedentota bacterium]